MRMYDRSTLKLLAVFVLAACAVILGQSAPKQRIAEALRAHGCTNVKIEVIQNSVHYVADEQPEAVAQLIERYALL
jgi:pimeloyl-ACP methyl ester carboxylesterase